MLIMITNKEILCQLVTNMILKAELTFKIMICNQETENIQLCSVNNNTIYLKMLKIFQTSTTTINKETFYPLVINTTHRAELTFKTMTCNQEMENIQLCSVNKNIAIIYQKTLKISLMLTMIINKETLFPPVINTTHRTKLTIKIMQCNQEMENILLCLMKKKTKKLINIRNTINIIIKPLKMNKNFK